MHPERHLERDNKRDDVDDLDFRGRSEQKAYQGEYHGQQPGQETPLALAAAAAIQEVPGRCDEVVPWLGAEHPGLFGRTDTDAFSRAQVGMA